MIYRAGIFIVVEIPGMDVQIKWDRGTRVYIKIGNRWQGRVQGLCGNNNGDAFDDLKTPSLGIETSPLIFGDSWKLQDFCASKYNNFLFYIVKTWSKHGIEDHVHVTIILKNKSIRS